MPIWCPAGRQRAHVQRDSRKLLLSSYVVVESPVAIAESSRTRL